MKVFGCRWYVVLNKSKVINGEIVVFFNSVLQKLPGEDDEEHLCEWPVSWFKCMVRQLQVQVEQALLLHWPAL
jgi:hypothetical protein